MYMYSSIIWSKFVVYIVAPARIGSLLSVSVYTSIDEASQTTYYDVAHPQQAESADYDVISNTFHLLCVDYVRWRNTQLTMTYLAHPQQIEMANYDVIILTLCCGWATSSYCVNRFYFMTSSVMYLNLGQIQKKNT